VGENRRTTTKEDSLSKAKEVAEGWYSQLRGKLRDGELKSGKPFREAAKLYLREFERLKARPRPVGGPGRKGSRKDMGDWQQPGATDLLFPKWSRDLFKAILEEEKLQVDREGNPRTAYSLRHTYICLRLLEGADIYQIAKNCRTSVEMIEKYYASHLKTQLNALAINVMRPRPKKAVSKKGPRRVEAPPLADAM